jgi:hypothetical protein
VTDKFLVRLSDEQRLFVDTLINRARCSPTTLIRAMILRKADSGLTGQIPHDDEVAREVHASPSTVYRVRKRFSEQGLQAALFPKMRAGSRHGQRRLFEPAG